MVRFRSSSAFSIAERAQAQGAEVLLTSFGRVKRMTERRSLVDAGKPLFTLADHSTGWAMLQVPEETLARVKTGRAVERSVDSLPGRVFMSRLT